MSVMEDIRTAQHNVHSSTIARLGYTVSEQERITADTILFGLLNTHCATEEYV